MAHSGNPSCRLSPFGPCQADLVTPRYPSGATIKKKNAIRTVVAGLALGVSAIASIVPANAANNYTGCNPDSLCVYQYRGGDGGVLSIPIPSTLPSKWINLSGKKFDNNASADNQISSVWIASSRGNLCVDFSQNPNGGGWIWGMSIGVKADVPHEGSFNYDNQISSYQFFDCTH